MLFSTFSATTFVNLQFCSRLFECVSFVLFLCKCIGEGLLTHFHRSDCEGCLSNVLTHVLTIGSSVLDIPCVQRCRLKRCVCFARHCLLLLLPLLLLLLKTHMALCTLSIVLVCVCEMAKASCCWHIGMLTFITCTIVLLWGSRCILQLRRCQRKLGFMGWAYSGMNSNQ